MNAASVERPVKLEEGATQFRFEQVSKHVSLMLLLRQHETWEKSLSRVVRGLFPIGRQPLQRGIPPLWALAA
jgi:hypothetical protein